MEIWFHSRRWLATHPTLFAALLGIGIGLPFVYPHLLPLAYLCFFGLFVLMSTAELRQLPKYLSLVFGVKALIVLSWVWSTYPIDWLFELSAVAQIIAIFLYWVSGAVWLASSGVVLAFLLRLRHRVPHWLLPLFLSGTVILAEYVGSFGFSLLTMGPGAYLSTAFSFGYSGYLFPWLYPVALWGGVYSVGLVGLLLVAGMYHASAGARGQGASWVGAMVGLALFAYLMLPTPEQPYTMALVQTTFPRTKPVDWPARTKALEEMASSALALAPDYLLFPEDSRYLTEGYKASLVGAVDATTAWQILHKDMMTMVVDSGRTVDGQTGAVVQRAYVWNQESAVYTADKHYLVPQGEYMPSLYTQALRFLGLQVAADYIANTINYTSSDRIVAADAPPTVPHILFCFESVDPLAAKRLVDARPVDFIVHPISHSWFYGSSRLGHQLNTMVRFQAVYAGVPIVSVGNDTKGRVYLPNGTVVVPRTVATFPYGTVELVESIIP